ncbi:MAG: alpha/beta hydrolase [Verrucomicrobiales bacterium]
MPARTTSRFPVALLLAISLASASLSCRMWPDDVLRPATAHAGASRVDLLLATTREPDEDPLVGFSSRRSSDLHYARFAMSVPPVHKPGKIKWPRSIPPDAEIQLCVIDWQKIDCVAFSKELKNAVGPRGRQVFLIVHGYNTGFALALLRSTQLLHDSQLDVAPVLFSWASRGRLSSYGYDRESASMARDGLEDLLRQFDADPQVGSVSILAHSMGTWLTMETLRQMGIARRGGMGKIRDIVLAAPDIDPAEFRVQWQRAREAMPESKVPRITIFSSGDDIALKTSTKLWGNKERLGLLDPNAPDFPSWMEKNEVTVIDITRLRSGDPISHSKYANAPGIPREIGKLIASGQLDPTGRAGVGERIASGAAGLSGDAARTIVGVATAPLAVTDDAGRKRLSDRIGDLFGRRKQTGKPGQNE